MTLGQLRALRFFSLLFLLPGLAGLIYSTSVSTHYLESLPRLPVAGEQRFVPRNIHGTVVYQTEEEDRQLSLLENGSVGVFMVGLVLGVVYLRKWGIAHALNADEDEYAYETE